MPLLCVCTEGKNEIIFSFYEIGCLFLHSKPVDDVLIQHAHSHTELPTVHSIHTRYWGKRVCCCCCFFLFFTHHISLYNNKIDIYSVSAAYFRYTEPSMCSSFRLSMLSLFPSVPSTFTPPFSKCNFYAGLISVTVFVWWRWAQSRRSTSERQRDTQTYSE